MKEIIIDDVFCPFDEDIAREIFNKMDKQLQRLKQENEKLKADLKAETEQAQKWYQRETDKHFIVIKYKQALEKIREIATKALNSNDCYVYMYAGKMYCKPIVDKINEVLND